MEARLLSRRGVYAHNSRTSFCPSLTPSERRQRSDRTYTIGCRACLASRAHRLGSLLGQGKIWQVQQQQHAQQHGYETPAQAHRYLLMVSFIASCLLGAIVRDSGWTPGECGLVGHRFVYNTLVRFCVHVLGWQLYSHTDAECTAQFFAGTTTELQPTAVDDFLLTFSCCVLRFNRPWSGALVTTRIVV